MRAVGRKVYRCFYTSICPEYIEFSSQQAMDRPIHQSSKCVMIFLDENTNRMECSSVHSPLTDSDMIDYLFRM